MNGMPPVVIDNGSGYAKLGYAGNNQPQFVIPSAMAIREKPGEVRPCTGLDDLDFFIGEEAFDKAGAGYSVKYPIRHGLVEDWDLMERFWEQCIFKYMHSEPEDHVFLLTEAPMNTPENRETMAEIMFESFNVRGLYIAVQAVLALAASWLSSSGTRTLTGTVVDSGDGITNVIPVVEGYVIGSHIKQIPVSGRDVTHFIQTLIREREVGVPPEQSLETARQIKEQLCYVCPDIVQEFTKYDTDPSKWRKTFNGLNNINQNQFSIDIGYERFLAPEIFFHPEFANPDYLESISTVVDNVIQLCPIDVRRGLYKNIVLSGGSTLFKDFDKRLRRDIQRIVNFRLKSIPSEDAQIKPQPINVQVMSHSMQKYAVWFGGSLIANTVSIEK
ncbi:hypothetical protein GJ496_001881 [Pomphorhynchus laevis]|nr:hypothetical protein GJ496_001881 [Pomphorhynchus laevis]